MDFRILGPVEVHHNGRNHQVGSFKEQHALAVLILASGRLIPAHALAERIWDDPPGRWKPTLQTYISRLRSALRDAGAEAELVVSGVGGYRLETDPATVDAHQFDQLIAEAQAAAAEQNLAVARGKLALAETLWRSEALAGLSGRWAETMRRGLTGRRHGALLARLCMDLHDGVEHESVVSQLSELSRTSDLGLDTAEILTKTLTGAGARREVLAGFHAACTRLRSEAGGEIAQAFRWIVGDLPDTAHARVVAQPGRAPGGLALGEPAHLVGREEEVHNVLATLARGPVTPGGPTVYVLDGAAGVGKSATVLAAAHSLAPQCPDGAVRIDFHSHAPHRRPLDAHLALKLLLEACSLKTAAPGQEAPTSELAQRWHRTAFDRRLLLVFDNVLDVSQLAGLIPNVPGPVILVTARQKLDLPGAYQATLAPLREAASIRLLARNTGRGVAENEYRARDRIIEDCAGLPLALALVGAHLRANPARSITGLAQAMADGRAVGGSAVPAPIRRAFGASFHTLPHEHRALLQRAARHPEWEFSIDAVTAHGDGGLLEEVRHRCYAIHDLLRNAVIEVTTRQTEPANRTRRVEPPAPRGSSGHSDSQHPDRRAQTEGFGLARKTTLPTSGNLQSEETTTPQPQQATGVAQIASANFLGDDAVPQPLSAAMAFEDNETTREAEISQNAVTDAHGGLDDGAPGPARTAGVMSTYARAPLVARTGVKDARPLRVGSFNMLFGGHDDAGFGAPSRWDGQMQLLEALDLDVLAIQEASAFDLLGSRRLHRMVNDLDMAQGFLAEANATTTGHRFHSAILVSRRVRVLAEGSDRARYHHVLGWISLEVPGLPGHLEIKNVHLDPFDPRHRAIETGPFEVLGDPKRFAAAIGDYNGIGTGFPEPDWSKLEPHLRNGHLGLPGTEWEGIADRSAVRLPERAGMVDVAVLCGQGHVPTGGFAPDDLEKQQDIGLLSPALAGLASNYEVHKQFVTLGLSDHAAFTFEVDVRRRREGPDAVRADTGY